MKVKPTIIAVSVLIAVFVVGLADSGIAQCSMCRKIATDGANSEEVAGSLNFAILYLMALPYTLLMFFFRKQILGFFRSFTNK